MATAWQLVWGSVLLAGLAAAQEPAMGPTIEGVVHWPAAKIKAYPAGLKAKEPTVRGDRKAMMALERIGNRNGYSFTEERRDESGVPEMHTGLEDILIIHDGEVTMVYGGKMEDRTEPRPGEFRGSKITGGTAVKLAAGDMLLVPERVPHHMIVEKGKAVTSWRSRCRSINREGRRCEDRSLTVAARHEMAFVYGKASLMDTVTELRG